MRVKQNLISQHLTGEKSTFDGKMISLTLSRNLLMGQWGVTENGLFETEYIVDKIEW